MEVTPPTYEEMAEAILDLDQWLRNNEWAVTIEAPAGELGTIAEKLRALSRETTTKETR